MIDKNTKIKMMVNPEGYERTHSGSDACFRPKGSRSFQDHLTLKAPKKGMKSEFMDGSWYWVCGCPDCLGIESNQDTRYHICDDHNICVTCGTRSKDLPEGVTRWANSNGFRCSICQEKINHRDKIKALEKFESEEHDEFDFWCEDEIKCPHCGTIQSSDNIQDSSDEEYCETCDGAYSVEVDYTVSYSTTIKGERVTLESVKKEQSK